MPEIDPSKVVKMFENLLGSRFGRIVATLLLTAAVLFAFIWLFNQIWVLAGRPIVEALGGIPLPSGSMFAGQNIQEIAATFMLLLTLYGVVAVALLYFLGRSLFKKNVSQSALDKLAKLRNEGIDTVYAVKISSEQEFAAWKRTKEEWEKKLRGHIEKNFPKADYLFASHLGVVPMHQINIAFNNEHLRELCFVIRQIDIVEQILNSYRR